ncbi:MAG: flagellin [Oscillospiraceae bacterium]|nr:flagellin [Oscillospiraceae bacterium]
MTVRNQLNTMGLANKLSTSSNKLWKTSDKLASGSRINRAANDAAGLAIAMKMTSQIGGTGQAIRNVSDGMSLIRTAEGALGGTQTMLGRMEMLSLQAANGTLNDTQRGFIQQEIDQIKSEINRVANSTNFNKINLLDGSLSEKNGGITMQIGADDAAEQRLDVSIEAMTTSGLKISSVDVTTADGALKAISEMGRAIGMVSEQRAYLGATQNRLEHTANNLINSSYNLTASKSRISDTDMAAEIIEMTTQKIQQQAQMAMLAHKIKEPKGVWQLLNQGAAPPFMA